MLLLFWRGAAPTTGPQPTGGIEHWFRDSLYDQIRREREKYQLDEEQAEVIERLAKEQAKREGLIDEVKATRALLRALEASHIAWERRFDEALFAFRDVYRVWEMKTLLEMGGVYDRIRLDENNDEEAALLLLFASIA